MWERSLTFTEAIPSPCVPCWRVDRADRNSFRSLSRVDHNAEEFDEIEGAVAYITNLMHWSAEHSVPRTSGVHNCWPVPWWSEECRQVVVERRRVFGRFRCYKTDFCRNEYKRARARARRALKEARQTLFISYISTCNAQTPMSQVWKRVHTIAKKYTPSPPPVLRISGATVADGVAVADTLAETFVNISRCASRPHIIQQLLDPEEGRAPDFSSFGTEL